MSVYDRSFFEQRRTRTYRSAEGIVPVALDALEGEVDSVIDFGAGSGIWLKVFHDAGVPSLLGIEPHAPADTLEIPRSNLLMQDLTEPVTLKQRFDLAVCLEVAEHLPETRSDVLLDSVTHASDTILWSAAVPGQGGRGHVNEQWPSYWVTRFRDRGYGCWDVIRPQVWHDESIADFYRQNVILFIRGAADRLAGPIDVVHPELFTRWHAQHADESSVQLTDRLKRLARLTAKGLRG